MFPNLFGEILDTQIGEYNPPRLTSELEVDVWLGWLLWVLLPPEGVVWLVVVPPVPVPEGDVEELALFDEEWESEDTVKMVLMVSQQELPDMISIILIASETRNKICIRIFVLS